jgi:hypothetical protein
MNSECLELKVGAVSSDTRGDFDSSSPSHTTKAFFKQEVRISERTSLRFAGLHFYARVVPSPDTIATERTGYDCLRRRTSKDEAGGVEIRDWARPSSPSAVFSEMAYGWGLLDLKEGSHEAEQGTHRTRQERTRRAQPCADRTTRRIVATERRVDGEGHRKGNHPPRIRPVHCANRRPCSTEATKEGKGAFRRED